MNATIVYVGPVSEDTTLFVGPPKLEVPRWPSGKLRVIHSSVTLCFAKQVQEQMN